MKVVALFPEDKNNEFDNHLMNTDYAIGLREYFEEAEHELIVIKKDSELDKHLEDVNIIINSPFWPAYISRERIEKAPNLQLTITAGVGSDHVDLDAAVDNDITVTEIAGSNTVSVAEHVVMTILILIHNYEEGHRQAQVGEWNLPKVGNHAYDLENKTVGIYGLGTIGKLIVDRLEAFDVNLIHNKRTPEEYKSSKYVEFDELIEKSDIISVNTPLTDDTENQFDKEALSKMKEGSYLVNTARGKIVKRDDIVEAIETGHIQGYGGDVWYPQPAPEDHPWYNLDRSAMTIHYSGMTIDAQKRIETGVQEVLTQFLNDEPIDEERLIVEAGNIANSSYQDK